MSVGEVVEEAFRDWPFFANSGGGITISGGEPLLQAEFTEAILRAAKAESVHCCVETSGYGKWSSLERMAALTDVFLYDIKETDDAHHLDYTGVPTELIISNLHRLYAAGSRIRLRLPVIPGYNDRKEHFAAIGALVSEMPSLEGIEIIPYNGLGEGKCERFGLDRAPHLDMEAPEKVQVASWIECLEDFGVRVICAASE